MSTGVAREVPKQLRSMLYVPGHRKQWITRVLESSADALILDLEDSVPRDLTDTARSIVAKALAAAPLSGPKLFVRINCLATGLTGTDLDVVVKPGLAGIVLPKVRSVEDVQSVDEALSAAEVENGMVPNSITLVPLLETAAGILNGYNIFSASTRVEYAGAMVSDGGDVAAALGYNWGSDGSVTDWLRHYVLLLARAAGVQFPVCGIWPTVHDQDGLRQFAKANREIGYTGMAVIHPSHLEATNLAFGADAEDFARADSLLRAMTSARESGLGAIVHDGQMVDRAMEATAKNFLATRARKESKN